MIGRKIHRNAILILLGLAAFTAGCETGFIQESAATSLASFLSDVFTTAVNETLVGN